MSEKNTTKKPVDGNFLKKDRIQVHWGNAEALKLKLLDSINTSLVELVKLLKEKK